MAASGQQLYATAIGATAPPAAAPITVSITCPPGHSAGMQVQVAHPTSGAMQVLTVPAGIAAGQSFQVQFAAAPAAVMAAPAPAAPVMAAPMVVPPPKPAGLTVSVQVPPGMGPGQQLQIAHPSSGQPFKLTIPQGVSAGMSFQVQLPAASVQAVRPVAAQPAFSAPQPQRYEAPRQQYAAPARQQYAPAPQQYRPSRARQQHVVHHQTVHHQQRAGQGILGAVVGGIFDGPDGGGRRGYGLGDGMRGGRTVVRSDDGHDDARIVRTRRRDDDGGRGGFSLFSDDGRGDDGLF